MERKERPRKKEIERDRKYMTSRDRVRKGKIETDRQRQKRKKEIG